MKNKYLLYISGLIIIYLVSNCTKQRSDAISYTTVDGKAVLLCNTDKISETRELKLSEIAEYSEIIRLSNDTSALLGNTWLRRTSADHLFISDLQNTLFLFDREGNFIKSWKQGNGPNEFLIPGNPQLVNNKVYVQDLRKGRLIEYCLNTGSERTIKTVKNNGISVVLEDSSLLSAGLSTSAEDPYLVCIQDFEGNVLQSIRAHSHINTGTKIVGEDPTVTAVEGGWNIHFPTNDTLFHYSRKENSLSPVAVFQSLSNIEKKKKHYTERAKNGIKLSDQELASVINVVPEYETGRYYFLSIYTFGEKKNMPWYVASRKICLVDKRSNEAFYVKFTNDFWGDIPFSPPGNSHIWSNSIIQDFSAIRIQKQFNDLIKAESLDSTSRKKIKKFLSQINDDDNKIVFFYKLKEN